MKFKFAVCAIVFQLFSFQIFAVAAESGTLEMKTPKPKSLLPSIMDGSFNVSTRTYPLGGTVGADLGLRFPIWGEPSSPGLPKPFEYGSGRLGVKTATAGKFNSAAAEVALYPIPILEMAGGLNTQHMSGELKDYNCESYRCQGNLNGSYLRTSVVVGYRDWFGVLRSTWQRWSKVDDARPFVEVESAILGSPQGDSQSTQMMVVGKKLNDKLSLAAQLSYSEMDRSNHVQRQASLLTVHKNKEWTYIFGSGEFSSTLKERGLILFFKLGYTLAPSQGYF